MLSETLLENDHSNPVQRERPNGKRVIRVSTCNGDGISSHQSNGDADSNIIFKKARRSSDMTLEDMYNNNLDGFDEDDEDSDWEPLEHDNTELLPLKWFCPNCTMVNFQDGFFCNVCPRSRSFLTICGEHKESGIVKCGFFASPFMHEKDTTQSGSGVNGKSRGCIDLGSSNFAQKNSTAIGFDERMLLHSEVQMRSVPHPERPDRLRAIVASLATAGILPGKCFPIPAREITREELQKVSDRLLQIKVHAVENVEAVELTSNTLASYFTPDTYANQHSALAARLAAGLCADLASAIVSGRVKNGFALVRPPGHHAGIRDAMGFCLHNNAAVAASAALLAGAKKVLIVDWDVHHGNGTQEIFEESKSVLYISLHRHEGGKFYPGTGAAEEVGTSGAEGFCVNVPWSCGGVGDIDYIFAFKNVILPIATEFAPDITVISAGFDAARGDPLGCCDVTPAGYAQMTQMLTTLSGGKLLVILEGGYNLRSISSSATQVIKVLLGESDEYKVNSIVPTDSGLRTVMKVLKIQKNFWPSLNSIFSNLRSQWPLFSFRNKSKKVRASMPILWKYGRKAFLYRGFYEHRFGRWFMN